ncbi:MAG: hypothetical protein AB7F59_12580 [Bdellovibrionales bacterium]
MKSFTKLAAFAAAALLSASAMAADGTAELDFSYFAAGFELSHDAGKVTGSQSNLGNGSGAVKLERKNNMWEGHFGFGNTEVRRNVTRDGKIEIEVSTLPGGHSRFVVETKADETRLSGILFNGSSVWANVKKDGSKMSAGGRVVAVDLKSRDGGKTFAGTASVLTRRGYETSPTKLVSTGTLAPATLIAADPALFALIYVIPYAR